MKSSILSIVALSLFCCASLLAVTHERAQQIFPPTVAFNANGQEYRLKETGATIRKKFFVKVYDVAHYLQEGTNLPGSNKFESILSIDKAKQLTLKWDRSVPAVKVQEGYHESFVKTLSETEQSQLRSQIDTFIGLFNRDVQKGDEHILRWIPGGTIEVSVNGNTVGSIANEAFAKGLWGIWLGKNSVVDRNALVSLIR